MTINEGEKPEMFKKFWKVFQKVILEAMSYNKNTIEKWLEYVKLTRKEGGEIYPSSEKKRSKELIKIREKGEKLIYVIIASIRYRNKPDYRKIEIASVIKVICEHYVFYEDDNMILDDKVEENLLGNRKLLMYGYIIEDDELDMRFAKFEEWLEKTGIAEVKNREYNTMKYFKEILHMEESIAEEKNREKVKKFQKSITYKWWNNKYGKIWESNKITNMIIAKIIEKKGFIEEYSNVEELINSDDTEESENSDKHFEMILKNYWIENDYEIDIKEIIQILDFRIEHKIMKTKDFMEYYVMIKELDNEEIIKELKK
ncbi:hypothetical protein C1646_770736 [Rhizophagus diaphanus]|nr:hypothetical protein C1646_770736 [Rhizophagus diaphanus] [Rhizophagus sp. MUCL 43196]